MTIIYNHFSSNKLAFVHRSTFYMQVKCQSHDSLKRYLKKIKVKIGFPEYCQNSLELGTCLWSVTICEVKPDTRREALKYIQQIFEKKLNIKDNFSHYTTRWACIRNINSSTCIQVRGFTFTSCGDKQYRTKQVERCSWLSFFVMYSYTDWSLLCLIFFWVLLLVLFIPVILDEQYIDYPWMSNTLISPEWA